MARPDLTEHAEAERADLLALLRDLSPEQWTAESLCQGWSVRDVAVHVMSFEELSPIALVGTFLRGGLQPGRVNDVALRRYADHGPAEVVALHERCARPRGLTAALGGGIALTDGTIHHQDVRRALGLPRTIPAERLVPVLDFSLTAPTLPSRRHKRGLRLVATDVDFRRGDGAELRGPGEALLMGLAGRVQAVDELSGPGAVILRERLTGPA